MARYLRRIRRRCDPGIRWLTFLQNHREVIVAFDFFTVPTVTFLLLYCFFVIEHGRRKILHFNVTPHPTAEWVVQQLREAFPEVAPYRYVILDRDSKFDAEVITFLKATGLTPKRTSVQAPWQKDYASYCTSWVPCVTISFTSWRSDSFLPCAFRGGFLPGCSNRQSFLSLQA